MLRPTDQKEGDQENLGETSFFEGFYANSKTESLEEFDPFIFYHVGRVC